MVLVVAVDVLCACVVHVSATCVGVCSTQWVLLQRGRGPQAKAFSGTAMHAALQGFWLVVIHRFMAQSLCTTAPVTRMA